MLGSIFEVVFTVFKSYSSSGSGVLWIGLGAGRITTLIAMVISHAIIYWQPYHDNDPEAYENLLGNGDSNNTQYGAVSNEQPADEAAAPRPKGGWLDYFIGFRILFPYIWYVYRD
jgi:hypothetical protein